MTETIDLSDELITRTIRRELVIPGSTDSRSRFSRLYVPVMRFPLSSQIGTARLIDPQTHSEVSFLAHAEAKNLTSLLLLTATLEAAPADDPSEDHIRIAQLVHHGETKAAREFQLLFSEQIPPLLRGCDTRDFMSIANLARMFLSYQFMFADCHSGPGDRMVLELSQQANFLPFYSESTIGKVKNFLGQRPVRFRFPVDLAAETESYHQIVVGPNRYFCASHSLAESRWLVDDERGLASRGFREYEPPDDVLVRWRQIQHSTDIELYIHNLSHRMANRLASRLIFYEQTPGPTFATALLCLVTTAVVAVIATGISGLLSDVNGTGVPAVVLAIPGSLSLLGRITRTENGQLVRVALLTMFARMAVVVLSIGSSLGYLLSDVWYRNHDYHLNAAIHGAWWTAVGLSSFLTVTLFRRSWRLWKLYRKAALK